MQDPSAVPLYEASDGQLSTWKNHATLASSAMNDAARRCRSLAADRLRNIFTKVINQHIPRLHTHLTPS